MGFFQSIVVKEICFVCLFFFTHCLAQQGVSNLRKCADSKCEVLISTGKTKLRYSSPSENVLSFDSNDDVRIFSKGAGSNPDLWGVEIKGRRGYAPYAFIREERVFIPDGGIHHVIPTEFYEEPIPSHHESFNSPETDHIGIEMINKSQSDDVNLKNVTNYAEQEENYPLIAEENTNAENSELRQSQADHNVPTLKTDNANDANGIHHDEIVHSRERDSTKETGKTTEVFNEINLNKNLNEFHSGDDIESHVVTEAHNDYWMSDWEEEFVDKNNGFQEENQNILVEKNEKELEEGENEKDLEQQKELDKLKSEIKEMELEFANKIKLEEHRNKELLEAQRLEVQNAKEREVEFVNQKELEIMKKKEVEIAQNEDEIAEEKRKLLDEFRKQKELEHVELVKKQVLEEVVMNQNLVKEKEARSVETENNIQIISDIKDRSDVFSHENSRLSSSHETDIEVTTVSHEDGMEVVDGTTIFLDDTDFMVPTPATEEVPILSFTQAVFNEVHPTPTSLESVAIHSTIAPSGLSTDQMDPSDSSSEIEPSSVLDKTQSWMSSVTEVLFGASDEEDWQAIPRPDTVLVVDGNEENIGKAAHSEVIGTIDDVKMSSKVSESGNEAVGNFDIENKISEDPMTYASVSATNEEYMGNEDSQSAYNASSDINNAQIEMNYESIIETNGETGTVANTDTITLSNYNDDQLVLNDQSELNDVIVDSHIREESQESVSQHIHNHERSRMLEFLSRDHTAPGSGHHEMHIDIYNGHCLSDGSEAQCPETDTLTPQENGQLSSQFPEVDVPQQLPFEETVSSNQFKDIWNWICNLTDSLLPDYAIFQWNQFHHQLFQRGNISYRLLVLLVLESVVIVLIYCIYLLMKKCSSNASLITEIKLLTKENVTLWRAYEKAKKTPAIIALNETESKLVGPIIESVPCEDSIEKNEELLLKISTLESELRESNANAEELHTMLGELLKSQSDASDFQKSVDCLQQMLDGQRNKVYQLTTDLKLKTRLNEELQTELLMTREKASKLQQQIELVTISLEEINSSKSEINSKLNSEMERMEKLLKEEIERKETEHREEMEELKGNMEDVNKESMQWKERCQIKEAELKVSKECLKQLRLPVSKGIDSEKRLESIFDIIQVKAELEKLENDAKGVTEKLLLAEEREKLILEELEGAKRRAAESEEKAKQAEEERQKGASQLEVLGKYFKEKEAQLTKELESQEYLRQDAQGSASAISRKIKSYELDVTSLKSQVEMLQKEIDEQNNSFKIQLTTEEQKSRDIWLSARNFERKFEETRQENSQLRGRLLILQKTVDENQLLVQNGSSKRAMNGSVSSPIPDGSGPSLHRGGPESPHPPPPFLPPFMPPGMVGDMPPFMPFLPPMMPHRLPPTGGPFPPPERRSYSPGSDRSFRRFSPPPRRFSPPPRRFSPPNRRFSPPAHRRGSPEFFFRRHSDESPERSSGVGGAHSPQERNRRRWGVRGHGSPPPERGASPLPGNVSRDSYYEWDHRGSPPPVRRGYRMMSTNDDDAEQHLTPTVRGEVAGNKTSTPLSQGP